MGDRDKSELQKILIALGGIAEMSLVFYRNLVTMGATANEAFKLTQAFITAALYGSNNDLGSDRKFGESASKEN